MSHDSLTRFFIFCLESYKQAFNLSGKDAYEAFARTCVFDYLRKGYDVLHTQGQSYIVEDIADYIHNYPLKD